jgi:putative transposase
MEDVWLQPYRRKSASQRTRRRREADSNPRSVAEAALQLLMESDVEGMIGAGRYERSGEHTTWRNGYRDRTLDTRLGSLRLRIPKLRQGSYFAPFLEARKRSEKALIAVIQEAWIGSVSTRRVDLVQAMGLSG